MGFQLKTLAIIPVFAMLTCCGKSEKNGKETAADGTAKKVSAELSCESNIPQRYKSANNSSVNISETANSTVEGMVYIPGGSFMMGADNSQASRDEYPKHRVTVDGFYMDQTEVTNAQFAAFVKATGYVTTAEIKPDWNEIKKQLPPGTPKPSEDMLVAAALVFKPANSEVSLQDFSQWWEWKAGANWKHPQGSGSTIEGKDDYPVVQISWDDAMAYCKWAGKRLPTEAEWEYAARGGLENNIYSWGNQHVDSGKAKCNSWQGKFPFKNEVKDRFYRAAPVKSYLPNGYGLYEMSGNVWEWCSDFYRNDYYKNLKGTSNNPKGPSTSFDPDEPYSPKRVTRGGSFLCNDSYCSGYRVSRRMKSSPDTGLEHLGFRCVKDK